MLRHSSIESLNENTGADGRVGRGIQSGWAVGWAHDTRTVYSAVHAYLLLCGNRNHRVPSRLRQQLPSLV